MASPNSTSVAVFFESEFLESQLASATPSILDRFRQAIKRAAFYNGSPVRLSDVDLLFLRAFERRLRGDGMTKDRAIALARDLRDVARAGRLWLGDRREQIKLEEKQQRAGRRHRAQHRREALQQLPVLPQFAVAAEQLGLTGGDELCGSAMIDARLLVPTNN